MIKKQQMYKKSKLIERFSATKILFLILTLSLFLVNFTSAADFDNVKNYDEETKTITITNAFGLGDNIAEIKLDTPQVNYVVRGEDRLVAQFTITNENKYGNVFKDMEFYDVKRGMEKFSREFTYKYRTEREVVVDDYETVCKGEIQQPYSENDCTTSIVGNRTEKRYSWIELNKELELGKGEIVIGIFTDVYHGETIEWIPTLFGVRIEEWAIWTEGLSNGLQLYYRLEETSGDAEEAKAGIFNATITGVNQGALGFIDKGLYFDAVSLDNITFTDVDTLNSGNQTINFWAGPNVTASAVLISSPDSARLYVDFATGNWRALLNKNEGGNTGYFTVPSIQHEWQMLTYVLNGTNVLVYHNGTYKAMSASYIDMKTTTQYGCWGFDCPNDATSYQGGLDEIGIWNRTLTPTEITQLYNEGAGLSAEFGTIISLNTPEDNYENLSNVVLFNCSVTGLEQINNLSLIINGKVNTTVTGTSTTLSLEKELKIPFGTTTWNCNSTSNSNAIEEGTQRTINLGFIEQSQTFNLNVTETSNEDFKLNISLNETFISVSAILNYSGEETTGTTSCVAEDCVVTASRDIPLIDVEEKEENFNWILTLFDGASSFTTSTSMEQQGISMLHLEICNTTYRQETLNFTTYNEGNLSRIIPFNFDGTFYFWTGDGNIKRNNSFSVNDTEVTLCLSPNYTTMKTDATINYDEQINSTYTNRFYYFNEHNLTNSTQLINLYLLNEEDSTSFILKVQNENLLPVADALIEIHRFYPGTNEFRIVQIAKTDDNGKSIGFFETETVDYKFIIKKAGVTLLTTGVQKVIPETSPFTLTFNTGTNLDAPWTSQEEIVNLDSNLTWNETSGIVTYTYIDTSSNFTQSRLLVQEQSLVNSTAYILICNTTSALSSATLTCTVGNDSGFYIASSYITRTGEGLDKQITFQIETFSSQSGLLGLFFGWFLILIAVFMFKFNEIAGIWAVTGIVFLVNVFGLIKFGGVFVTAIIGVAIILTWVMER